MLKIYDIASARKTILNRSRGMEISLSPSVLKRTEALFGAGVTPTQAVQRILASVRDEGDSALRCWTELLDQQTVEQFRLTPESLEQSFHLLPEALKQALEVSLSRIRAFHALQPLPDWETSSLGGRLGQRVTPVDSVGVYVPGGTAPLPSSLLMSVIPAQVAGVKRIIVCTPPKVHPAILAVAYMCGIDEIYQVGGAQAVAAMAYGTQSIPRVNKIVGAGNLFVTLAKQQVFGLVGLDGLAGPTETMVIADGAANAEWVAADLLAQAEHDFLASSILLTPDRYLAERVQVAVARQIENLSRAEIIVSSLENRGGIVLTHDLESAAELANEYAPEHLCLAVVDPASLAVQISNAGGLFMGEGSFEVLGDYIAGPSHVMPTGGSARFASPLNVMDFVKITSIIALDNQTSRELSAKAAEIARVESLTAHAAAASLRAEALESQGTR